MNKKEYERDLKDRQRRHLESLDNEFWQPCLHDQCQECHGTGIRKNGGMCVHGIACTCPKCSPRC